MYRLIALLILLTLLAPDSFSQNGRIESSIISKHKITEKKTYRLLFNKGQSDTTLFLIFSVKYNNTGYPVLQTRFKEDGSISDKFISEYQSDSLEIKRTSYGSENIISDELTFSYDTKGNLVYRKNTDKIREGYREQFYELDSLHHLSKDYNLVDQEKMLTAVHEYDKNWKKIKDTYYNPNGEIFNTFLTEYDSVNNLIKSFSFKSGIKTLHTEKHYNAANLLIEEINYYTNPVKVWDLNGLVESYKKGDKKEVKYFYDARGLMSEQTEFLNNKFITKIKYEYL